MHSHAGAMGTSEPLLLLGLPLLLSVDSIPYFAAVSNCIVYGTSVRADYIVDKFNSYAALLPFCSASGLSTPFLTRSFNCLDAVT